MKKFISTLIVLCFAATLLLTANYCGTYKQTEFIPLESITYKIEETSEETIIEEVSMNEYDLLALEMQQKLDEIEVISDKKEWFVTYKEIINEYSNIFDMPETIYDIFTPEEINLICRVVETETYQCNFESKVNVACVVFNRLEDGAFGETIKEIVTAKNQFAYGRKNITEDTIIAVEYAFEMEDTTDGALFFHSNKKTDTFCGNDFIFQDEAGHNFY